jgi:hypothetical protein
VSVDDADIAVDADVADVDYLANNDNLMLLMKLAQYP